MNCRWIGCDRCKKYVDAGYRWAYWMLEEPGIVKPGEPVDLSALLSQHEFWNPTPDEDSSWLTEQVLPTLKHFLNKHRDHGLRYVESDMVWDPEGRFADWAEDESGRR